MQTSRAILSLFLGSLALRLVWLALAPYAVYPDAAYYDAGARAMASGRLEIPFLWSWIETGFTIPERLDLPLPAFPHWGPLASLVGVPFVWLFGALPFAPALPHLIAGAALAPLTYLLARRFDAPHPLAAGLLALGAGFYGPMLSQPDNFALYGLLATGALVASGLARGGALRGWAIAGLLSGLAWLSRTDGLILAGSIGLLALAERGLLRKGAAVAALLAGFAVPTLPWVIRQIATFGSAIPSGRSGAIWIRTYNEQFAAGGPFTIDHLFSDGILPVISSRIEALGLFFSITSVWLLALLFVPGLVAGVWGRRRDRRLAPFGLYALAYAAWSILFAAPHLAGGNLLHGLLALGPISWLLAIEGSSRLLSLSERRGLMRPGSDRRLGRVLIPIVIVVGFVMPIRTTLPVWEDYRALGAEIGATIIRAGLSDRVVMATGPVPIWRAGIERTVLLPTSPAETVERAIRAAGVGVIVLDPAHQPELIELWGGDTRPDWLGVPIELTITESGASRTLLVLPVLASPPD